MKYEPEETPWPLDVAQEYTEGAVEPPSRLAVIGLLSMIKTRDAQIAELEEDAKRRGDTIQVALDSRDKAERYSDEVSAERDAAVKREEAEAKLRRGLYREVHEAMNGLEMAERREAAALASLEALREAVRGYRAAGPADRKPETYEARRNLFAALDATTEGAGKVLAERDERVGKAEWVKGYQDGVRDKEDIVQALEQSHANAIERVRAEEAEATLGLIVDGVGKCDLPRPLNPHAALGWLRAEIKHRVATSYARGRSDQVGILSDGGDDD